MVQLRSPASITASALALLPIGSPPDAAAGGSRKQCGQWLAGTPSRQRNERWRTRTGQRRREHLAVVVVYHEAGGILELGRIPVVGSEPRRERQRDTAALPAGGDLGSAAGLVADEGAAQVEPRGPE